MEKNQIKVEPLQNGEREELHIKKSDWKTNLRIMIGLLEEKDAHSWQETIVNYVEELLSQSKKEAIKNLFTDEEWNLILYGVSSNAFKDTGDYDRLSKMIENEDGNVDGHYIYKYDLLLDKVRSLTNQKKDI